MLETLGERGLLLVRDSADSEGRSLLRAIASEAVARAEQVLVVLLEVPREQFQEGLSPHVRERLRFLELFRDPLGWLGRDPPGPGGLLGGLRGGRGRGPSPTLLLLDSLSWALLREPLPHLGPALLGGGAGPPEEPPPRIVALLHQELHPPPVLAALGGLARAQLVLGGPPETPGAPRRLRLLRDPRKGGGALQETLTLLPDGSLGGPPQPDPPPALGDPSPNWGDPKKPQKAPNSGGTPLTFGAVGGRAGGEGGADPRTCPGPSPRRPPRTPRIPTRTWSCDPPGNPKFGGKSPKTEPNKGAAPPPPCPAAFGAKSQKFGKKSPI
ncbi:elongator complex protein 5 [Camarhynchus parvulus]|uniref:elongator complex protein 5 n=1 Tax=Geospiza parvula TaxID=87175 RepID=UPI001238011D|nr:elongator complex protein 5 [Camarhynchus parvulus]